jgi:hypothetical protein
MMSEIAKMIARVRVLLSDQEDQEFTEAEIIAELNAANIDFNDELGYYVRSESLPIIEGQLHFDLPHDCMKLERLKYDGPRGDELTLVHENVFLQSGAKTIVAIRENGGNSFSLSEGIFAESGVGQNSSGVWAE